MRQRLCRLALAAALVPAVAGAAPAPVPRFSAGVAFGGGVGAARVDGARLEFGRSRFAPAVALRGGVVVSPAWLLGLQLDAVGAGSGEVVRLGPVIPGVVAPATTTHRVAVNHFSLVGTWRPQGGMAFVRAGAGLAESFTENWDDPVAAVRRSFGPGAVAGFGLAPRLANGARVSVNADVLGGRYAGRPSWAATLTVGIESF